MNKLKNSRKIKAVVAFKLFLKIIFLFSVLINTSCGEKALLEELGTDRMNVILKGTYESEPGYIWPWNFPADVNDPLIQDDSVLYTVGNDLRPTQLMLDIAEIRIMASDGAEYKFANYRQTYTINLTDDDPFFSSGIVLKTDDVTPGKTYILLRIYLRKIVFNNSTQYTSSDGGANWSYTGQSTATFAENSVYGFDLTSSMMNTYWDSLRMEAPYVNRVFPVDIHIPGGFQFSVADARTILELRLLVKNFIKKFETVSYSSGVMTLTHYWGFSDQLRNVKINEPYYGGNLLGIVRNYVPALSRTLTVTGIAANKYIILVPAGSSSADYIASADARTLVPNCDYPRAPLNPGIYINQLMDYYLYSDKYNIVASTCSQYSTEWDAYSSKVLAFRMPVAAAYNSTASGTIIFSNLKPGAYDVYYSNTDVSASVTYGKIFNSAITKISGSSGTVDLTGGNQTVAY